MADLGKILDGMTGEEVANIIYNNDNTLRTEVSQTKTSLENSLDSIVDSKLSGMNLDDKIDQSVNNRLSKPLTISLSENKAGTYSIGGETLDIYEKSIRLLSLPRTVGDTRIASAGVSPNDDTFTGAGNNTWNSELNFSLSETSDISVSGYLEGDGIPQYAGSRPGFNLLKITKLS